MAAPQPPLPLALVIADTIWRDFGTSKRAILGCFSAIGSDRFPAIHPQIAIYVALTEGYGPMPFRMCIIDSNEERDPVAEATGVLPFNDPRAVLEFDIH